MSQVFLSPINFPLERSAVSKAKPQSRKRNLNRERKTECETQSFPDEETQDDSPSQIEDDYKAVLSPEERSQRRLAGYPLTEPGPTFPFPHAPLRSRKSSKHGTRSDDIGIQDRHGASLRSQHIAAMSALLHKSLLRHDYERASRALGLILRTDVGGRTIDIRAGGNWAIAAEILLRRTRSSTTGTDPELPTHDPPQARSTNARGEPVSKLGFENAKALYEKLIIQHPYHKSWPGSINAVDFNIAMFNLWVYVAQQEKTAETTQNGDASEQHSSDEDVASSLQQSLESANAIAASMDECMRSAPFGDNLELIRLRANVALWQKHLNEELMKVAFVPERKYSVDEITDSLRPMDLNSTTGDGEGLVAHSQYREASRSAEDMALRLFERLASSNSESSD